ncbi:MAG: ASPIC/UnbV domain-containing protein, partial [Phycisphaerales bacterium]|nr:ASPIC/UnbV domain-containing protein [Phycisphaerales bacterium]
APVSVFRNQGQKIGDAHAPMGNWLSIELKQKGANPNAIGARISVRIGNRSLVKDVDIGGGHASGTLGFEHFGVGTAERAQIRVRWPDGSWSHGYRVFTNAFVVIERDNPNAIQWHPQ